MSLSLSKIDIPSRASLVTSTIIRDTSKRVVVCPNPVTSICTLELDINERNLFDENVLIVWASTSSDLALYEQFKENSDGEDLCLLNKQGHSCYHLFNKNI